MSGDNEIIPVWDEEYTVWNDPDAPAFQNLSPFDKWLIDEPIRPFPFKSMVQRWINDRQRDEKYGNYLVKVRRVEYSDYTVLSNEELWTTD